MPAVCRAPPEYSPMVCRRAGRRGRCCGSSGFAFDRENWLINTFWVWLSIQIVRIRYVILSAIRLLAFQWMGGFGPDKTGFLTALETNNFPAPEAYVLRLMITWAVSGIMRMRTMRRDLRLLQMLGARQGIRLWPAF
jgi:hypothetical protein